MKTTIAKMTEEQEQKQEQPEQPEPELTTKQEYARVYYQENKQKYKEYADKNKQRIREQKKVWYSKNQDVIKERNAQFREANRGRVNCPHCGRELNKSYIRYHILNRHSGNPKPEKINSRVKVGLTEDDKLKKMVEALTKDITKYKRYKKADIIELARTLGIATTGVFREELALRIVRAIKNGVVIDTEREPVVEDDKEYDNEKKAQRYEANKEKRKEKDARYREANKEQIKEKKAHYRAENREKINAKKRERIKCPHCEKDLARGSLRGHIKSNHRENE